MLSRMATWYRPRRFLAFASLVLQVSEGGEGELLQVSVSAVVSPTLRDQNRDSPVQAGRNPIALSNSPQIAQQSRASLQTDGTPVSPACPPAPQDIIADSQHEGHQESHLIVAVGRHPCLRHGELAVPDLS